VIKGAVRHKLGRHCQFLLTNLGRAGLLVAYLVGIPASFGESTSITAQAPFQVVAKGFEKPTGLVGDPKGALFLTDSKAGVLYRLTPGFTASGVPAFTSSVVFAGLDEPIGVAIEQAGHLLVAEADKGRLVRFAKLSDLVFSAVPVPVVDDLKEPRWLTVDGEGGIFVSAETVKDKKLPKGQPKPKEEVLLKLSPEGTLSLVADRFEQLRGVTIDAAGTLYAAAKGRKGDDEKRKGTIFRIHLPDGTVSRAIVADFKDPVDLKFDALGALFFTAKKFEPSEERDADKHEKKDDSAESREADNEDDKDDADEHGKSLKGVILKATFKDDGTLKALAVFASGLGDPAGLALDHDGNLYVAERKHGQVLRFQAPDPPVVAPQPPAFTQQRTLTVRGKAEPKALITVTGGASPATGLAEGSSGAFAIDVTLTADSEQTLRVFATGSGGDGLTSRATKAAVTQDDIPPDTNISGCPTRPLTTSTATFGFSGTDNLTPPSQLRFASSLDGAPFSPFSSNTSVTFTALTPGLHTLRVKAQDQASNEDLTPERCTFTVVAAGLTITINTPGPGATVSPGSVLVRGILDAGGVEVGVAINGVPAAVEGTTFAALVPVAPDTTSLTAMGTTATGLSVTHTITITVSTASVSTLLTNPQTGVAPLAVGFALSGVTASATIALDFDGNGTIDFAGPSLVGQTFIYAQPGVYFPKTTITDAQGNQFSATTVVQVFDGTAFATFLRSKWTAFRDALGRNDIDGAVAFVADGEKVKYRSAFQRLSLDLPSVAAGLRDIQLLSFRGGIGECVTTQDRDGGTFVHFIYFMQDQDGIWKIVAM